MSLIVEAHVARAAQDLVATWPLSSFIALNPLAGHEKTRFEDIAEPGIALTRTQAEYRAAHESGRITTADLHAALRERIPELAGIPPVVLSRTSHSAEQILTGELLAIPADAASDPAPPLGDPLETHVTKWVAAYLNPQPEWPMPGRERGLYTAWQSLAASDPGLPKSARKKVTALPTAALPALTACLSALGIPDPAVVDALRVELAASPGWTGHIKWRADHVGDIDLTDYLAVRFALRHALGLPLPPSTPAETGASPELWTRTRGVCAALGEDPTTENLAAVARVLALHPPQAHPFTWQTAYELHYRSALLAKIGRQPQPAPRPQVQVVMCIDPRSEGVRRHLEANPATETLGLAGFFGIPFRFAGYDARGAVDSLPALLSPRHAITEKPVNRDTAQRRRGRLGAMDAASWALHVTESSTATPFALAETAGWFYGAGTLARTVFPGLSARVTERGRRLLSPPLATEVTVADAFTLDERAALAETAVRMMGLNRFAPLIVLAGHGSTSANNLYQSALDCGACGGNPGAVNARAAATIFNDTRVRQRLAARGLEIPDDTFFLAALHDTVADTVTPLDEHLIPDSHRAAVAGFVRDQQSAADRLVRERAASLPGATPRQRVSRVRSRAHDWAEVYPELGLAGNAAMIVGPREMTAGVDLHRRVFLHSYRPEMDPDGGALETILTAPVVVAQWINHQYYFSTVNPDTLGAGTKTIHNAIGTIGVISGHNGDLRRGLPWQSVRVGDALLHEPLRLAVIVQGPLERIGDIISRNQVLRDLFDNDWITLTARPDADAPWYRYTRYGWSEMTQPRTDKEPHRCTD